MPPVNTPAVPSPTRSPSRPLTPFTYLSSPAPDLASTLHTHSHAAAAADAADEANTDFLRDSLDALDTLASASSQPRPQNPRSRSRSSSTARTAFLDPRRDPRLAPAADDLSRRERLQRVLARLNRAHEPQPAAPEGAAYGDRTPSPRAQRLYDWAPGAGAQADADAEDGHDGEEEGGGELDAILAELRRQQPESGSSSSGDLLRLFGRRANGLEGSGSPARAASYMRVNGTVETYEQMSERRRRERQSLRNRVLLQRARQEASPSGTERMLRYVVERERSGMSEEEERVRGGAWVGSATGRLGAEGERLELPRMHELDRLERVEAFRRGFLAEHEQARLPPVWSGATSSASAPSAAASTLLLENALKYLSDLRSSRSYEDSLATAIANNLATKEFFADKHEDFMLDLDDIDPPAPSSWLQPGAVFQGHQHASSASMNITHQRHAQPGTHIEQINPNYRQNEHPSSTRSIGSFDASRPWLSHQIPPAPRPPAANPTPSDPANDHWPVRVTIHNIDWEKMTIQGTMEAYDVPQHPASAVNILNPGATPEHRPKAGKKSAPITTYLEGHILDHHTHSFLTPASPSGPKDPAPGAAAATTPFSDAISFPSATAPLDAQNWLALPPFNALSEPTSSPAKTPPPPPPTSPSTLARLLLSRSRLRALGEEYVFMRWKERCFVHSRHDGCTSSSSDRLGDQDRGHGLTISGFYYVSLRRRDGHVEGLYFDPSSTPYQLLRLRGRGGGWGSFEMR